MRVVGCIGLAIVCLAGCIPEKSRTLGYVERFDPALDEIIAADVLPEILGEG